MGLPDFIYQAEVRKVGSGCRELGDRILIVGDLGIVAQVKSRVAESSDPDKERRWIEKEVRKALRQGQGTVRSLKREPARLTNARGRTVEVNGNDLRWIVVVIVDHASVPEELVISDSEIGDRFVVLLRRDWQFLFEQLKSVHAVGSYLERVSDDRVALGEEPVRYYELATADAESTPQPLHPAIAELGGRLFSEPQLPMAPAGHDGGLEHRLVRFIFEDIARIRLEEISEAPRLELLAQLDGLPVGQRGEIGRYLLSGLEDVRDVPSDETKWHLRRVVAGNRNVQLAFGVGSQFSPMHQDAFSVWVQLRHYELQEIAPAGEELTTVGVLLTPRQDGLRPWDTTMVGVSGAIVLSEEELAAYRELWALSKAAPGHVAT